MNPGLPINPRTATLLAAETNTNTLPAILPQLSHLLSHSPDLHLAFLSHPSTPQIWKFVPTEGQWCGYRNLQMLLLSLASILPPTSPVLQKNDFLKTKLTIPHLQLLIESAWTQGFNAHSRDQLGGRLVGTTTFIGTPEAEALLLSLGVPCTGRVFKGPEAWIELLDSVEEYFSPSDSLSTPPDGNPVNVVPDDTPLESPRALHGHHRALALHFGKTPSARFRPGVESALCSQERGGAADVRGV
ncbi:hypothetical protein LTR91_002708 [Friedmanniomyces endolithicus]|uniref:UFSP1/2/DUB catalytic domain-containing protein n=1 Tax=Friedmanniomyces endolithicus TaxID=329885 RepID=A0AAN6JFE8_9PEZI|nr:hypothetical protein LTR35_006459 [Friedmanniomyces endolithicus]KAK0328157.1 hypothetical protein LTR82_000085 [Friedmanniomyces endolithicus]KAK0916972.1 hypothetical protein LTR57_012694 [Friedmanniomyces endolithicus]KAK0987995.1 hypothetical protein LTS01_009324 [Friedmanniomyces endolithicus]KAK1001605.1 hypothetical protein LTR54_008502 [Friedmanniomyces endolithicus]